jgi:hypothetical protein
MRYRPARWPKIVVGTIAVGSVLIFFAAPLWHPAKEKYFNYVASSCDEDHRIGTIPWGQVPAFDAHVERFVALKEADIAALDCINRWAGVIITNRYSPEVEYPMRERTVTGEQLAASPVQRYVYYDYIRPVD